MATLTYSETLLITKCWCGITFAGPENLIRKAWNSGQQIYCPNGHVCVWSETEADRLRKEKAKIESQLAGAQRSAAVWRDEAEGERRRHAATKGVLTKTKKRVAKGVCPCCNRSFVNVTNHMQTEHPGYAAEEKT